MLWLSFQSLFNVRVYDLIMDENNRTSLSFSTLASIALIKALSFRGYYFK